MRALTDRIIDSQEDKLGAPLDYLRSIADTSPAAFAKFAAAAPLFGHRRHAPLAVWHLARLAATRVQDCGTCVQIVVNQALAEGVAPATIRAALDGGDLSPDERLAFHYGEAVAQRDVGGVVDAVRERFGEPVLVELALAVATAQLFPILKRGLGQSVACALVEINVGTTPPGGGGVARPGHD